MRLIRLSNRTRAILVALGLSLSVFVQQSTISVSAVNPQTDNQTDNQSDRSAQASTRILSVTATAGEDGVLIEWRTSYEIDNVGFNLYREQAGRRTRVNASIIPGSALIVGEGIPLRGGYSYSAFDQGGTLDATYHLESIDLQGTVSRNAPVAPVLRLGASKPYPKLEANSTSGSDTGADFAQRSWPASLKEEISANGAIEDQWAIASQPALKIGVRQVGWYRLTQGQLVAAGLDPATDAGNLRMFVGAREMAIRVSRNSGALGAGDFIEFYGSGLDTLSTDSQTYWLTGGSVLGRRIATAGPVGKEGGRSLQPPQSTPSAPPANEGGFFSFPGEWFHPAPRAGRNSSANRSEPSLGTEQNSRAERDRSLSSDGLPQTDEKPVVSHQAENDQLAKNSVGSDAAAKAINSTPRTMPVAKGQSVARAFKSRKRKRSARKFSARRNLKRNHAGAMTASAPANFLQVVERKDRGTYYSSLKNGETENFFGAVLISPNPITQSLALKNVDLSADGPAQLEVAVQGVSSAAHQVNIFFNDVQVGTLDFAYQDHRAGSFSIPIALLRQGSNDVRFVPLDGGGTMIIDHARVTYPRKYRAKNNSLSFSAGFNETVEVDGFTSANLRVLDVTDPLSTEEVRPVLETSGQGYAITVPASDSMTAGRRMLVVFANDHFQHPATVSFNQPSTLNSNSNGANLLIISHASFLSSASPLVSQRQGQGMAVTTVDVEDIYDEFNFGTRSPYAVKNFLSRAATQWTPAPRYVMLLGDASYDPRNYQAQGNVDFVPTKLVDTVYMETASDDWLADFNNDGVPEMAVGRLPARTVAEANAMISKIVNFLPANVPQSALLVADAQGSYYFNFELANQQVAALLPPSITVQTVNRRTEPSDAAAKANIISKFNSGQAVVNYSGHGNVNAWAGSIFTSGDALALTNGNKVPFAVVMDCLNGYFVEPRILGEGLAESLMKAPNGGAVAAFASSGLTIPDGQHEMSNRLYQLLYGSTSLPLGDIVKQAKLATVDIDVRRTWIFFGDPSMKIR